MPLALLLGALLGATQPGSPLETPQPPRARTPGIGRVLQATATRAYLDAGADDGLAAGQVLALRRGEVEAARCTVEAVGPTHATCAGAGVRPGDTFKLSPPPAPEVKVVVLPPPPSDDELARRAAAVAAAPLVQVVDKGTGPATTLALPRTVLGEVDFGDAYWGESHGASWDVASLNAALHGVPLGDLVVDVDLRAERWLSRGPATFRPGDQTRLYVWQAQAAWAPADRALSLTAGRVLPWTIPGATVLDGAVVGWRREGTELGVFGGLVPQPDTLGPTSTRATGGAYWQVDRRLGKAVVFREEGRLAWVRSPELGDRGELETGASLHAGAALDLYASVRLGLGGTVKSSGLVDGARLEGSVRPAERLSLSGGVEYGGLAVPQSIVPAAYGTRNLRADLTASYDLGRWRLGLVGGTSRDDVSKLDRSWVGPEVQLPTFLTPRLSLSAGYMEELGWLNGRSAYLQAVARPWDRLRLIARTSWTHEASLGTDRDELGLLLSSVAELNDRFGLRLSLLGRYGIDPASREGASAPLGLNGSLSLYALF
jgi:hypothetical protein